ncbi:hypothetical protein ACFSHR_00330 [Azotobacter chroococcum]
MNAYLLEHFMPPSAVTAVRIWADKDRREGGQKAALALKKRLWEMGIKAQILLPWLPIPDGAKESTGTTFFWNAVRSASRNRPRLTAPCGRPCASFFDEFKP